MRRICPCCDSVDTFPEGTRRHRCRNCGHLALTQEFATSVSAGELDLSDREVMCNGGFQRKRHFEEAA